MQVKNKIFNTYLVTFRVTFWVTFVTGILWLCPSLSLAESWQAIINDENNLPKTFIVVDKSAKKFEVMEKKSPLSIEDSMECITGEKAGDKIIEGDLKTPEGVYFVTSKIQYGLDFNKYGGIAYPINYPNPIDRLKDKTGSGIWVHSKGQGIKNQVTEGCIAIDLDKIAEVGPLLTPGTPVLIAENVQKNFTSGLPSNISSEVSGQITSDAPENKSVYMLVAEKTRDWNLAWEARSETMFDFYEGQKYSKAQGESFESFVQQKESLFSRLAWIDILYSDVNVLQGPDYWVSWFEQFYVAPNVRTKGIRRLYWQPDESGELKIVGMEWLPSESQLDQVYLEKVSPSVHEFVEIWKNAWLSMDLEAYANCYKVNAIQDNRKGAEIIQQKTEIWQKKQPVALDFTGLRVRTVSDGILVDMTQNFKDSTGYSDKGIKELLLYPEGNSWLIARESWRRSESK